MRRARIADLEATCCASAPLRTGRAEEGAPRRCAEAAEHRAVANAEFFFFFFFFFFWAWTGSSGPCAGERAATRELAARKGEVASATAAAARRGGGRHPGVRACSRWG
mmetsp:Transcript_19497/g.48731  ORF Transcript_19497/g.48731 Transcript_19497/m.48731 type:complete len:108 (-) Transcript_19497:1152-1475(-)